MRTSAIARLIVMGALLVALLLPLSMVQSVVTERASRRGSVVDEVSATWGGVQTVGGPVLTVPYRYSWVEGTGSRGRGWRKPSSCRKSSTSKARWRRNCWNAVSSRLPSTRPI